MEQFRLGDLAAAARASPLAAGSAALRGRARTVNANDFAFIGIELKK